VAPGARGGTSSSQFREKIANLSATGKELIAAIFQQARFHDWITAENVNAKQQFQKEYDELVNAQHGDTTAANTWIDCILAFETAANLGERDEMVIYGITATEDELASSKFESFLGFFDQAYRDHDYDVGRKRALGMPFPLREAIDLGFITPKLNKLLSL